MNEIVAPIYYVFSNDSDPMFKGADGIEAVVAGAATDGRAQTDTRRTCSTASRC
jgi:hypothetical protein